MVTYNNTTYYQICDTYTKDVYGIEMTINFTQLIYIDNGWLYSFQINEVPGSKYFSDFKTLMNSVEYPSANKAAADTSSSTNANGSTTENTNNEDVKYIVFWAVLFLSICLAALILVGKNKKINSDSDFDYDIEDSGLTNNSDPEEAEENSTKKPVQETSGVFCHNCRRKLPDDSEFCHFCGAKITIKSENL